MPANVSQQPGLQLAPIAADAPGSYGLNLQAQNSVLDPHWSIESLNTVIDANGRVAARNGRTTLTTGHTAAGQIRAIFEYLTPTGTSTPIVAFDGGISSSLTAPNGSSLVGTITSVASGRWFFQNFNGKCIGFQSGQKPIVLQSPVGTFSNIVEVGGTLSPTGGVGCCAYGRVWGLDGDGFTVKWCALQDETNWTTGDSGSIDLRKVWPLGMDTCTAIFAYGGSLVICGTKQLLVYGSSSNTVLGLDVTALRLVDAVEGAGCISQWTVAHIGGEKEHSDVLFCGKSGVQSIQRLVLASGSRPIQNHTKNVRDALITMLRAETASAISGFYSPSNGFYALTLPVSGYTWIVDQRHKFDDQDGDEVARVTRWPFATTACAEFSGRGVYMASNTAGNLYQYQAGTDDGVTFTVTLQTPWMDFGQDYAARLKALKRVGALIYGQQTSPVTYTWFIDFQPSGMSSQATLTGGSPAQWGIAQWGIDQWGGGGLLQLLNVNASGTGQYFSLSISSSASSNFAIQQVQLMAKALRLA
jgi:hypothetical protein